MPSGVVILVVDDEPALLESMRRYLSHLGHMVTGFRSAASAWDHIADDPSVYSVVIVDMTLTGMSGTEFVRKLLARHPAMAVLVTSGYPQSLADLEVPQGARLEKLEKPFAPRMLAAALERLLER